MSGAHVFIDRSQFPEQVRCDLVQSLRARALNHKFHYETYKQAAKWLALHEAYSPARTDASCARIYDEALAATAKECAASTVHLIGLGCGGGQKEARLAQLLREQNIELICTLSDVSLPLVLVARAAVSPFARQFHSAVCDLATAEDLAVIANAGDKSLPRIVTLFGIVPNFEPGPLLSRMAALLRADDRFLLSANLAPGPDYKAGAEKVLGQYDNALTRDWLMTLLLDLGFEHDDGELRFSIETDAAELHRITAWFELRRSCGIRVFGELIPFQAGERIRVFFSYRHTPQTITALLRRHSIAVSGQWLNDSGEEAVFLGRKIT
jgi:L-histidine Nalpha-methyltransferase